MFSTVFKMEEQRFVMGANCIPWAVSQHKPRAVMTFLTPKRHPPLSCSLSLSLPPSLPPSIAHTQSNGGIIVPQGFRRWHICHLEMCHCILKTRPSFLFGFSKIESSSWLSRLLACSHARFAFLFCQSSEESFPPTTSSQAREVSEEDLLLRGSAWC